MKRHIYISLSLLAALSVIFTGCNKDEELQPVSSNDQEAIANVEEVQSFFDDLSDMSEDIANEENEENATNRIARTFTCAEVIFDGDNRSIAVDFGDGCEGPEGRTIKGKMTISFSEEAWYETNFAIAFSLENFSIDGVGIEGTVTTTVLNNIFNKSPEYSVVLANGKVTWPDATFATREFDLKRTVHRGDNFQTVEAITTGTASGVTRLGHTYSTVVVEELSHKTECVSQGIFIASSGSKDITIDGGQSIRVDFGDGTCDRKFTLTRGDSVVEIDINQLQ